MYVGPWQDYHLLDRRRRVGEWALPLETFQDRVRDTVKGLDQEDAKRLLSLVNPLLADLARQAREEDQADRRLSHCRGRGRGGHAPLVPPLGPPQLPPIPVVKGAGAARPASLDIFSKPFSKKLTAMWGGVGGQAGEVGATMGRLDAGGLVSPCTLPCVVVAPCPVEEVRTSRSLNGRRPLRGGPCPPPPAASLSAPSSGRQPPTDYLDSHGAIKMLRLSERRARHHSSSGATYFRQFWWGQAVKKRPPPPQHPPPPAVADKLQLVKRMKHVYSAGPSTWTPPTPPPVAPLQVPLPPSSHLSTPHPHQPQPEPPTIIQQMELTDESMADVVAKYFSPLPLLQPVTVRVDPQSPPPYPACADDKSSSSWHPGSRLVSKAPLPLVSQGAEFEEVAASVPSSRSDGIVTENQAMRVDDLLQWVQSLQLDDEGGQDQRHRTPTS